MDERQRAELRRRLLQQEKDLREQLNWLQQGLGQNQQDSLSELSSYDNHPADLGSEVFERSKDLALRENTRRGLEAVQHALERLDTGGYGYCERCGQPIDAARLEARPETSMCLKCQNAVEAGSGHRRRPVEEEVIIPPFGGLEGQLPAPDEDAAWDGEDAWQEVARYGTSESVSDVPGGGKYPRVYPDNKEERAGVEDVDSLAYHRDRDDGMFYKD